MRTLVAVTISLAVVSAGVVTACGQHTDQVTGTTTARPHPQREAPAPGRAEPAHSVVARPVNPDPRVGVIFLGGGDLHVCTGSVLHSPGGDLVLTAAHCLPAGFPVTFVPGFADAAPAGDVWTVTAVYLDPRWVAARDPRADYAILRVSRAGGRSVEAQAGSAFTLGAAPARGSRVTVTAYAAGVGGRPIGCQAGTGITAGGFPELPCAGLVDGTSGAPWVSGSTVTGVIGGLDGGGCTDDVSYSPPFDDHTAALVARAEAGGPGDTAPSGIDDPC
ncbi:trypsin-like peptidase domain-containing protein [Mycobacterium sp.]|uniref:trypsin-like serine peptidase n=1 Tax=Mycobacterium sp. TaxID=1785 RepID=UPI0031DB8AD2